MASIIGSGDCSQYTGRLNTLVPSTNPAINFLAAYISSTDALDRSSLASQQFANLFSPQATFITKCGAADESVTIEKIQQMFVLRGTMLSKFTHADDDFGIVSLQNADTEKWTLMVETTSVSVFKDDPEQEEIRVGELLILKLEQAVAGKGVDGLWGVDVEASLDASAITAKAMALQETS